jgi:Zn-dependent protease with chaperone function
MVVKPVVRVASVVLASCLCTLHLAAQTIIKLPKNKYSPQQDVELGREAAAEVRKQYPIIKDESIARYLSTLGERLVAAAPPELKQPVYEFAFTPVNLKEINAFALPGGPMFVHRGMFDAAASEGEVAGVMAHELSHVLLRHGTANATKAQNPWMQLAQMAGAVGGSMVGGVAGQAISEGSQFGLGTVLLRYSRDFEKQADLLGAQVMARAGYDPRSLAHMFETIARQGGASEPQWLSDHPNPGNRTEYINKEAAALTVASPPDQSGFPQVKTSFAALTPAKTTGELPRANTLADTPRGETARQQSAGRLGQNVPKPSTQYRTLSAGVFQAAVPAEWSDLPSKTSLKVIPPNAYGDLNGQTVFTHGIEFGITPAESRDLWQATQALLRGVAQGNPGLQLDGNPRPIRISDRQGIATPLVDPSPLGDQEVITLYTTFLADGSTLFYYLSVAPEADIAVFQPAFRHIGESIRLNDGR